MKKYIKAKDVKKLYLGTSEFSLIDIREIGQHTDGHPFFSISIPYSIFENRIIDLIPSKETLIILMDHNDGLSEIVEEITSNLGYRNIQILKNGVFGWKKAGFFLFKGIHVPSKAFGELVELKKNTPHIKPSELRKKINKKDDIIVIDGRPFEEFKKMNIPTGVCCPNMEIPLRIQNEINDLRNQIAMLEKEEEKLKFDEKYIEKIAREKFKMVKPGERVFKVTDGESN